MTELDMAELMNRVNFLDVLKENTASEYKRNMDLYQRRMEELLDFFIRRSGKNENELPLN